MHVNVRGALRGSRSENTNTEGITYNTFATLSSIILNTYVTLETEAPLEITSLGLCGTSASSDDETRNQA